MDIHVNSDVLAIANQTFLELVGSSRPPTNQEGMHFF